MTTFMQEIASKLTGQLTPEHQKLAQAVIGMLNQDDANGGGVASLVTQFTKGGMGDIVKSWVGNGANQPIDPQQVTQALGSDKIAELAAHAGLSPDAVRSHLATLLPEIVNHLTPDGTVNSNMVGEVLTALASKYGAAA
jgi:uncharacterized protein YidB (DUF937 family)